MTRNLLWQRPMVLQFVAIVLGLAVALALFAAPVDAADFRANDTVRIGANETIDGDLFITGQSLIIEGTVNGDVFAAGDTISIRGTVNGGLNAAGRLISIEGPIERGVRAAGQEIVIAAPIGRDLVAFGQTAEVTSTGRVGGDVFVGAEQVTLAGDIGQRVFGGAETMRIAAAVGQGVDIEVNSLVVEQGAQINGDLRYRSNNEAQLAAGVVTGQVVRQAARTDFSADAGEAARNAFRGRVGWIVALALLGLLLLASARGWMERTVAQMWQRPWASLLMGLIVAIATVPAIFIVGGIVLVFFGWVFGGGGVLATMPLPLTGLGLYALALYISPVFVALLIGSMIMGRVSPTEDFRVPC
ncbi:MAG: hypothetical protein CL878_08910 [Dehalococcoidia bacterium]|nr:hypothetical protein [Dehalococcoidia bacterium]